jgi:LacI family transcriptional regulator
MARSILVNPREHAIRKVALLFEPKGVQQRMLSGIGQYAAERPHWRWKALAPQDSAVEPLRKWRPDGIIGMIETPKLAAAVVRMRIPVVDLAHWYRRPPGVRVTVDNAQVGRMAAAYFLERKFRHFGYVGLAEACFVQERLQAFAGALREAGFSCASLFIRKKPARSPAWSEADPEVGQWLNGLPKPAAIFACNDQVGLTVVATCVERKISVPEAVAVLGADNHELLCTLAHPALSSIRLPMRRMGWMAASLLESLLNGQRPPDQPLVLPSPGIVTRASTDRVMVADPLVRKALDLIRVNAGRRMQVADIVSAMLVSRRNLEYRFRKEVGRGIHGEIQLARVELAKKLLAETDFKLIGVARRAGFTSGARLSTSFQRYTGLKPSVYRREMKMG